MNETLYIVDGFSLIFRSYYAFIRSPLSYQGMNTGALYGFFQSIATLHQNESIDYLALVFDPPGKSFRNTIFADYKAHRPSPPEDLQQQIPIILEIIQESGLPYFCVDSYEADDVIASMVQTAKASNIPCKIVSSDKDLLQLLDTNVSMMKPAEKGRFELMDPAAVETKWGLRPNQIGDLLAIMGDSADNVPGVAGIGKVGATKLLQEYDSLDGVYEHLSDLKPGTQKKLSLGRDAALLSRKLVTLCSDIPLTISKELLQLSEEKLAAAHQGLKKYGIVHVFSGFSSETEAPKPQGIFRSDAYTTVQNEADLDTCIAECRKTRVFSLHCLQDAPDPMRANLIGISLSSKKGAGCYIPLRAPDDEPCLTEKTVIAALQSLVADKSLQYIGHDIKNDVKLLSCAGLDSWQAISFDTMVAAWLLDSSEGQYKLDHLAQRYLSHTPIQTEQLRANAGITTKQFDLAQLPLGAITQYCAERADLCLHLLPKFLALLTQQKLYPLFSELEMQLLPVLASMEVQGMYIKKEELERQSKLLQKEITSLQEKITREVGYDFNINSTQQLSKILFEERGLKPVKKTKTGFSTDSDVLSILAAQDPLPRLILRYRLLTKLKSTYLDALADLIHPTTQCIHTTFQQTVAATGRLSSKDPNLQNIPIKDAEGRRIRNAFVPHEGNVFVGADYSQIELVVLAHLSNDPALQRAFREKSDVHIQTAALIFNTAPDKISDEERRIAKMINFGVIYGMSAFRLSNELNIPRKRAQQFITSYFDLYRGVAQFSEQIIKQAESDGYVSTIMGRKRLLHNLHSKNFNLRSADQRIAVNTVIQGSAADIIKKAMIDMQQKIHAMKLPCTMVLQVHDELLLESSQEHASDVLAQLVSVMENAVRLSIPLTVSAEIGTRWGTLH